MVWTSVGNIAARFRKASISREDDGLAGSFSVVIPSYYVGVRATKSKS
jgi:hypothetical protein